MPLCCPQDAINSSYLAEEVLPLFILICDTNLYFEIMISTIVLSGNSELNVQIKFCKFCALQIRVSLCLFMWGLTSLSTLNRSYHDGKF